MVDIGFYEAALFFFRRVVVCITGVRRNGVMIIIAPFCEVICELETRGVGGGVFEVDDDELFVGVSWEEKGRFAGRFEAEDIAVLCLVLSVHTFLVPNNKDLHRYEQIPTAS